MTELRLFEMQGRLSRLTAEGERIYSNVARMDLLSDEIIKDATEAFRDLRGVV